jgi:hypothetical protein
MSEAELRKLERMGSYDECHCAADYIDAIRALTAEVRRCGGPYERILEGARKWDEMQKAKR